MANSVTVKLVPLLEWTRINGADKSNLVAIYNKDDKAKENVYFGRRTPDEWSPSGISNPDTNTDHARYTHANSFFDIETGAGGGYSRGKIGDNVLKRRDVVWSNKQPSVSNTCQSDHGVKADARTDKDGISGSVRECTSHIFIKPSHGEEGIGFHPWARIDGKKAVHCAGSRMGQEPESGWGSANSYEINQLSEHNITFEEQGIESASHEHVSSRTGTTTDSLPQQSDKCLGRFSRVICDKTEERYVQIKEHSAGNLRRISAGHLLQGHNSDAVTQSGNIENTSGEDVHSHNGSLDSCGESGGKIGYKHKHPVHTFSFPGVGGHSVEGTSSGSDYSQMDQHPLHPNSHDSSSTLLLGATDGNIEFINTHKGVVKYSPSLNWQVRTSDSCKSENIEISDEPNVKSDGPTVANGTAHQELCKEIPEASGQLTLASVDIVKQMDQSHPNVCYGIVNATPTVAAGAKLPISARSNIVYECVACSSAVAYNYNKLPDESVSDSPATKPTPLLQEDDCRFGKNKYIERSDVKGAIKDNNPELQSPRCPCCLTPPGGPSLENKYFIPELCGLLQLGQRPTSNTNTIGHNILKWQIHSNVETGQTGITSRGSGSSNIKINYRTDSQSCDDDDDEETAAIAGKRIVSCDDELPSGVEGEGMPCVGDTVDNQNSCYGVERHGAAAVASSSNTKLSIQKTAVSFLQLLVVPGKARLAPESLVLLQAHSDGSGDTPSPISSDVPDSASAGHIPSYAAVLRDNIKVNYHRVAGGNSSCPTSHTHASTRATSHQTDSSPEESNAEQTALVSGFGDNMGNQNSSGANGDRSRTPMLGRRKGSSRVPFGAASASLPRSVPVTPTSTPASIRSDKVGFFRKFRRNKSRSRSGSTASINSVSSCASTVSHGFPSKSCEDTASRDSQSSLGNNSSIAGDGPSHTVAGPPPSDLNTASVSVPAPQHTLKQQTTILQPISEKPNEMYSAHAHNPHSYLHHTSETYLAEKTADRINDECVAHRSPSLLKQPQGTSESNLTLTDDSSEYLTASETDLRRTNAGKTSDNIKGFNCDNYEVTCEANHQGTVSGDRTRRPEEDGDDSGRVTDMVVSSADGTRSISDIERLHGNSADCFLPDQVSYQTLHISGGTNTLTASTKPNKSDKKDSIGRTKLDKNPTWDQSKTYASVLGTGLYTPNSSDIAWKDGVDVPVPGTIVREGSLPKYIAFSESHDNSNRHGVNIPSQPAAPVCEVRSPHFAHKQDSMSTNSLPRSFADVVSAPSCNKRVVQPPRGPFSSLTRKDSSSCRISDTPVSEADQMPLAPGLHGKLPVAVSKHGIKRSHKPANEAPVPTKNTPPPPPAQGGANYRSIRPRTFASVVGIGSQGGGKGQIGVKTVPGGNAGSPVSTPEGPGGVTCHSLPRSALSSAGSAPALGVCGARLRAAKAHSVQQLNASRSPPLSPSQSPECSPFVGTCMSPQQQAKSLPQLPGKSVASKHDRSSAVAKVKSEESVKMAYTETSSLPRLSQRNKAITASKSSGQVNGGQTTRTRNDERKEDARRHKRKDTASTAGKDNLIIEEYGDRMSSIKDESLEATQNASVETSVSVAQECVSESAGSLHRLNTRVQQSMSDAKSDQLATKSRKISVTQILHRKRKTSAESDPDSSGEISSRLPVHAQKSCPPGQTVSSKEERKVAIQASEQGYHSSHNAGHSESACRSTSKLPASSPNRQSTAEDGIKPTQSVSNQNQTKQLVGNVNIIPREKTKGTEISNLRGKHEGAHSQKILIEKPSQGCIYGPRTGKASSSVTFREQRNSTKPVETASLTRTSGESRAEISDSSSAARDSTTRIAPAEKEIKTSTISTVENSKQDNKSADGAVDGTADGALEEEDARSAVPVGIPANTTQNIPLPEPRNDIKDEQKESFATSDESQLAQGTSFVTGHHHRSVSTISETSQQHDKLTIEQAENLEHKHTSVHIENVPTAKLYRDTEHLQAIKAANFATVSPKDVLNNKEMGSGESKSVEDGSKKVAGRKISQLEPQKTTLNHTKCDPDVRITGVSDRIGSNEKFETVDSDHTTVKGSRLPVKAKTECETEVSKLRRKEDGELGDDGEGASDVKRLEQEESRTPHPPPRTHKTSGASRSLQQPGHKDICKDQGKSEELSKSSFDVVPLGKMKSSSVQQMGYMSVKYRHNSVELPTDIVVTRRDESDKFAKRVDTNNDAKSEVKPNVNKENTGPGAEIYEQAEIRSADISRTMPGFTLEDDIATDILSSQGTSAERLQVNQKIITDTSGFKPLKMNSGSRVDLDPNSDSVTGKLLPGKTLAQYKVNSDIKTDLNSQIGQVTKETVINSKQNHKQSEPVDKLNVNIVESKDMQEDGLGSHQKNQSDATYSDTCEGNTEDTVRSSGSKPKIFDEMISVKDVSISSGSSSTYSSLEIDEKIQNDVHSVENSENSATAAISQVKTTAEFGTLEQTENKANKEDKLEEFVPPKIKISIEQPGSATEQLPACDVSNEPDEITEEEVTFTIDIPAKCAVAGEPLPEVNVYVSATCIAVTSTSGTINTASQLGVNETSTSVSDRQVSMSVSSGTNRPLASASAGGSAVQSHQKGLNICIDKGPSAAGLVEGSAQVKLAGQEVAERSNLTIINVDEATTAGTDMNVHTEQIGSVLDIVEVNEGYDERANDIGESSSEFVEHQSTDIVGTAPNTARSATETEPQQVQDVDVALAKTGENCSQQEENNMSVAGGEHPDKTDEIEEDGGIAAEHAAATVDPRSISKPLESKQAKSSTVASSEGSMCDNGSTQLTVGEIYVCGAGTTSKNTPPNISIATETAKKDLVVECSTPAECNVNNNESSAGITGYLKVDDILGIKVLESDCGSIGRLISDGENSDVNVDDIVVTNMEECNIKVKTLEIGSSGSSDCESDDEESSTRESESEEENNKIRSFRKGPDTVNDSDLSDDSCDKLKVNNKIEDVVEETSSEDESAESEDEKPKKCVTDEESYIIKDREELHGAKSPEDLYTTKLEEMGHKVGQAYFVVRRRKKIKMVDRETITTSTHQVQCPEVCHVSTDTFDSVLISSSGSSDTSPSRVQWEDDSVDELNAGQYEYYSEEEWYEDYSDDSVYTDDNEDSQLGATAAGPVKVIYSRPRPDLSRDPRQDSERC